MYSSSTFICGNMKIRLKGRFFLCAGKLKWNKSGHVAQKSSTEGKKYKKNYKWLLELSLIPINYCLCVCGCWAAQSCLQAGSSTCRSAKLIPWKASEEGSYLKMKREAEKWNKEYFSIHCLGGHWSVGAISIQCTADALIKLGSLKTPWVWLHVSLCVGAGVLGGRVFQGSDKCKIVPLIKERASAITEPASPRLKSHAWNTQWCYTH